MPLFVITAVDKPGALPVRLAHRPAHLAYLADHAAMVKLAGPFLHSAEGGEPRGSMLIVEAVDLAAAEAFAAGDPFAVAGLFESTKVEPWRITIGGFA
jgi:uncharacterized protein YciI